MSQFFRSVLAFIAVASVSFAADRPNIVLVMADDQGWGDVGYYGKSPVKTPVLDELAANNLRFDRFYAAAPVCSPTRGSVMTGRHPNRFACFTWGHSLRPQETTIAEALKKAGYTTGHFGKWHLGSTRSDSPVCPGQNGFDEWLSAPNFYENDPLMSHNGKVVQTKGESSQVPVDYAVNFMKKAVSQNKPFLSVIWFGSPHSPHIAGDKFKGLYEDQPAKTRDFLGELSGIDTAVGNLRTALREMKIEKETVLWYTSDNGALAVGSTGGLSGRKGNLLEGGIRVPAIIEWPGVITKPRQIMDMCGTVDIYPTVLELAGAKVEKQTPLDGQSIVGLIKGEKLERKKPFGFWVYPAKGRPMRSRVMLAAQGEEAKSGKIIPAKETEPDPTKTGGYSNKNLPGKSALLDGNWKLHRDPNKGGTYRLFDLDKDPTEKTDVSKQNADRLARMKKQLADWQASVIDSLNGKDYR
jgi:arylsulfatase A-like enzyme